MPLSSCLNLAQSNKITLLSNCVVRARQETRNDRGKKLSASGTDTTTSSSSFLARRNRHASASNLPPCFITRLLDACRDCVFLRGCVDFTWTCPRPQATMQYKTEPLAGIISRRFDEAFTSVQRQRGVVGCECCVYFTLRVSPAVDRNLPPRLASSCRMTALQ